MNVLARKPWTQDDFLAWAERQEGRFEFDGFQPVAVTGGNARHDRIIGNIHAALRTRLRGKPCSNYGPTLGVETTGSRIRYPDALITCTSFPDTEKIAPNAVTVFEVLSPTSGGIDRIERLREYEAVPSILRYVIVESATPGLQVLRRADGASPWIVHALTLTDILSVPEAQIEIPVAEFYQDVEFEPAIPA
jgi:Uma2 family endonuclease